MYVLVLTYVCMLCSIDETQLYVSLWIILVVVCIELSYITIKVGKMSW